MNFGTENVPTWALPYLINRDLDDISDDEIDQIKNWMNHAGIREVFCPDDEEEPHFTWNPPFGLACNVILCPVEYV